MFFGVDFAFVIAVCAGVGGPTMDDVMRSSLSGNTKLAARVYLISTGSSLKEAKAAVEKIRTEDKEQGS